MNMDRNNANLGHGVEDALNLQQQDAVFRQLVANEIFGHDVVLSDDILDQINAGIPAVIVPLNDQLNANLAAANAVIADFGNMLEEISTSNSEDLAYSGAVYKQSDVSHFSSFSNELRQNEQCHFGFVVRPEHMARGDMNADVHEPVYDARELYDNINHPPENVETINVNLEAEAGLASVESKTTIEAYLREATNDSASHASPRYENGEDTGRPWGLEEFLLAQGGSQVVGLQACYQAATDDAASHITFRYQNEDGTESAIGLEERLEAERAANAERVHWMHNGRAESSRFEEFLRAERAQKMDIVQWIHSGRLTAGMDQSPGSRKRKMVECLDEFDDDRLLTTSQSDTDISQRKKRRKLVPNVQKSNSAVHISHGQIWPDRV